jgi:hypothetical protein
MIIRSSVGRFETGLMLKATCESPQSHNLRFQPPYRSIAFCLNISRPLVACRQTAEQIRVEPLTADVCLESVNLPGVFHRDPADRLVVALARKLNAELITADTKILQYVGVRAVSAS